MILAWIENWVVYKHMLIVKCKIIIMRMNIKNISL